MRRRVAEILIQDSQSIVVDTTQWHQYELFWRQEATSFLVDGKQVLETTASPRGPLGLVLWIDNQAAAWKPDGQIGYRLLQGENGAWMEVKNIQVH